MNTKQRKITLFINLLYIRIITGKYFVPHLFFWYFTFAKKNDMKKLSYAQRCAKTYTFLEVEDLVKQERQKVQEQITNKLSMKVNRKSKQLQTQLNTVNFIDNSFTKQLQELKQKVKQQELIILAYKKLLPDIKIVITDGAPSGALPTNENL